MNEIVAESIKNSFSYKSYRKLIKELLVDGKSTGNEQSEALTHFSELNETRMNRLEKTLKVSNAVLDKLAKLQQKYIWLVLSEGWCGDAAQILPILNQMAQTSENIKLRIVLRDENEALMNLFLTQGSKSIPKLIILDAETLEVIGNWGPRPEPARKLIVDYKAKHNTIDEFAKIELQKWYLHDKGETTQTEILQLLESKELV